MTFETTPKSRASRHRRIVAIDLPTFTADLARIRRRRSNQTGSSSGNVENRGESAVLVFEERRGRRVVKACCFQARDRGVGSDMSLAEAMVLVRDDVGPHGGPGKEAAPIIVAANPGRSRKALERLAIDCLRFAPIAAVDGEAGILLDIHGCERWLAPKGGESGLLDRIEAMCRRTGFGVRTAIADTVVAARAWARWRPMEMRSTRHDHRRLPSEAIWSGIDPLPVECLDLENEIVDRLHQVNVRRVGELRRLPRASLPARYGPAVHRRLDQVTGRGGDAFNEARVRTVRHVDRILASRTFGGPVRSREAVELAVVDLIGGLHDRLQAIGAGARIVRIVADRVDAPPWIDQVELARATRRPVHLWSVIEPLVERLPLDHAIDTVALEAARHHRLRDRSAPIFPGAPTGDGDPRLEESFSAFVDLVQARFGSGAMRRFDPTPGHAPEDRMRLGPLGRRTNDAEASIPGVIRQAFTSAGPRPTTWFDRPEPIRIIPGSDPRSEVTDLPPAHDVPPTGIQWRGRHRNVAMAIGPETIGAPWWRRSDTEGVSGVTGGEAGLRRDYWSVRLEDGIAIWIFRASSNGRWFVQGLWA